MIDLLKRKDGSDEGSDQSQEKSENSNSDYFSVENSDNESKNPPINKEGETREISGKREDEDEDILAAPKSNYSSQIQPRKILKRKEIIYEPKVKHTEPVSTNQNEEKFQEEDEKEKNKERDKEKEANPIRKFERRSNPYNQNIEYVAKVKPKTEIEQEPYPNPNTDQDNRNFKEFSYKADQEINDENYQDPPKISLNKNNIVYVKKEKPKESTFEYVPKQQIQGKSYRQKPQANYTKKRTGKNWRDMNSSGNVPSYIPKPNTEEMQKMNSSDFKLNSDAKNFIPKTTMQKAESTGIPQYYNNSFNFPIQNTIFYQQYPILIPPIIPPPIEAKIPEQKLILNVNSQEYIPSSKREKDRIPEKKDPEETSNLNPKTEKTETSNEIKLNINCKEYQPPKKNKGKETNNYLNQQFVSVQLGIPPINLPPGTVPQISGYPGQPVIYSPYYYSSK